MPRELWLVTGGAGFIGSHVAEELARRGARVRVFDNFSTGTAAKMASFKAQVDLVRGDLLDPAACRRAVKGATYILHQAAIRSVPKSVDNPTASHDANATGTLNLLLAARDAKVRRVVYASTSSAYGDAKVFPQVETMKPHPLSPYEIGRAHV